MEEVRKWIRTELWDHVPLSISVIDRSYNIVEANAAFTAKYGPWHDRPCYAVYKDRDEPCERCAALESFADGEVRTREEMGRIREDQQTYYLVQMVPLVRDDGKIAHIVEMSTDITMTKQLESDKLQAERLAAVGQTVAGLAHGIKNVLMGLDGGMYVMRSGLEKGDADRISSGWTMLEENIGRITSFVGEFLEFAKGREPEVTLIDPNEIARGVVDLFKDSARLAGIDLMAELDFRVEPAPMDPEGLRICLENLISNALDACSISDRSERSVLMKTCDDGKHLTFEVSDNGVGMAYEVKKKIFTNFFSTKGSHKGTGLGLLTTRKIVQEHQGKVTVESEEGSGSVFRLQFDIARLQKLIEHSAEAKNA